MTSEKRVERILTVAIDLEFVGCQQGAQKQPNGGRTAESFNIAAMKSHAGEWARMR